MQFSLRLLIMLALLLLGQQVARGQCPATCTFTAPAGGTNYNLNGNQSLCITGNVPGGLSINFNGSSNTICVASGVTWTQPAGGNFSGVTINVFGTFTMNGNYNFNTPVVINVQPGGTLNTDASGFGANLLIRNEGRVIFTATGPITHQSSFSYINATATATLSATATSLFKVGNGNTFLNFGTMTFSNLENEEAMWFTNYSTGKITIGRYFFNHGNLLNSGYIETICGPFGLVACEFIVGNKGPGKEYRLDPGGCMKVNGNVVFDGPGFVDGTLAISNGNLTLNNTLSGMNGKIIVENGTSTIGAAGSLRGTNMKFCDRNTSGGNFDAISSNSVPLNNYQVDCTIQTCVQASATCALSLPTPTPGTCQTATNLYTVTGTISLSLNTGGGTATLTDGPRSLTVTVPAAATSVAYSLSGLVSGVATHTLTVSLPGCGSALATYTSPATCTFCTAITVLPASLTAGQVGTAYSQQLTASGGTAPYNFTVGQGSLPTGLSLSTTGLLAGTPTQATITSLTVVVTDARACTVAVPYTLTIVPTCSLTLTATAGVCNLTTNQYSTTGVVTISNLLASNTLFIGNGAHFLTSVVTATASTTVAYTLLAESDGATRTVSTSLAGCGVASLPVTGPPACFTACAASCQPVHLLYFPPGQSASGQFSFQNTTTQARIGSGTVGGATWETAFTQSGSNPLVQGELAWANGVPASFTLTYNPAAVPTVNKLVYRIVSGATSTTMAVDPQQPGLANTPPAAVNYNALQFVTSSTSSLSTATYLTQFDNLAFNGVPLNTTVSSGSVTNSAASATLILKTNAPNQPFTVTGNLTLSWTGALPNNARLNSTVSYGIATACAVPLVTTVNNGTLTCQSSGSATVLTATNSQTAVAFQWAGPAGFAATTPSITATAPGTYTVLSANNQTGCTATNSSSVVQQPGVVVTLFGQSACQNNATNATTTDDFYTLQVQATNPTPGAAGRYEVVLGADALGLGGTVLNPGGTPYGTTVGLGGTGQPNAGGFRADGISLYSLTLRDSNNSSSNAGCRVQQLTGEVFPCSTCLPLPCLPIRYRRL